MIFDLTSAGILGIQAASMNKSPAAPMPRLIPVSQGNFALVDEEDYFKVCNIPWHISHGYAVNVYRSTSMHRVIAGAKKGETIHHKNHNGLDNRKCNLKLCAQVENTQAVRPRFISREEPVYTSKYKGVSWRKDRQVWTAYIGSTVDGKGLKRVRLGVFRDEKEAARAYNQAALKYYGEFAVLNEV